MMSDNEMTDVDRVKTWAAAKKLNDATAAAIISLGFDSMEALSLISAEDLTKSKITIGQQKLLLKAVRQTFISTDDQGSNMADGENQLPAAGPGQSGVNTTPSSSMSGANAVSGGNVNNTSSAQGENQQDTYVQEIISQLQQQQSTTANHNPSTGSSFVSDNLSWQDPQVYLKSLVDTKDLSNHHDIVDFVKLA
jgi:hypothetical protein